VVPGTVASNTVAPGRVGPGALVPGWPRRRSPPCRLSPPNRPR